MFSNDSKQPLELFPSEVSLQKRLLIKAVRRGHLVTLRLCVPELRATLRMSHADHSQLALLVDTAFAVYSFARICLLVSKLPVANSAHLCMAHLTQILSKEKIDNAGKCY